MDKHSLSFYGYFQVSVTQKNTVAQLTGFQNASAQLFSSSPLCSSSFTGHINHFPRLSVPSPASCWCKPPLRPLTCQWRPFVLIQDCTILKKSTWWRQCDTTENINGPTDTRQGGTVFPHSNIENNEQQFVWLLRDVPVESNTRQSINCDWLRFGSQCVVKAHFSFSHS